MTPAEARVVFATFSPDLRAAMKAAALAEGWTPAQWVDETELVADLVQMPDHTRAVESALLGLYARITAEKKPR
jgi:hypothetical protein